MEICTIGTKVYQDTYGGMLKGVIVECRHKTPFDGMFAHDPIVNMKVTSKTNRVYKYGEIISCDTIRTFPRVCYHRTGIFTYRVSDYTWKFTE